MASAIERLQAARPQLTGVRTAEEALGLAPLQLLHAGPPLRDPRSPPRTLASSIVVTCLHEGWAQDEAEAEHLLRDGKLTLMPAQAHACVTPLAAIVSPHTPLLEVRDAGGEGGAVYAPVSAVRGADTRMGMRDPALLSRLQGRDTVVAPALQQALAAGPIALWPLALAGLAAGDDLHSRTAGANEALTSLLRTRGAGPLADEIAATPLFFLTLWMAASALVLRAAEGADLPSLVTRAGGNGEQFGICLAARPQHWVCCTAEPPRGPMLAHIPAGTHLNGAVGDSAVIDMLGLGGQRLAFATEPRELVLAYLPASLAEVDGLERHARALLAAPHPLLPDAWPLGVDAARVAALGTAPLVMLAMLAEDGWTGFTGRGVYAPPAALFREAIDALRGGAV